MEWSNEVTLNFLDAYQNEELLWNPRHPQHKNKNLKYDAWKRIESNLNIPLKTIKKKKESLLANYRKLARKVADTKKSGCGTDEVYQPVWFAYSRMAKFLQAVYLPNETLNTEVCIINGFINFSIQR